MAAASQDALLAELNDRLAATRDARGVRGGLGRVKGGTGATNTPAGAAAEAFKAIHQAAKWPPAGEDPLYRRFT
eukprot:CAMPEP_0113837930 /NCGR_PEP_ID=MMETSP0328-20130328/10272_1 /TAXON_ID=39455 /ORGANISM="Alexandrium minutum" /LENGTH=73 /DNA_ID=CAMNT_0000806437 /DNA_START=1 /DNA_END=218 /DNA_ORIENTATION=+ /assembly_acc=CAM_ASM_000350